MDKIIDKIRKLMALAGSPNEHEALLAMEKAQSLIAEHKIAMHEVMKEQGPTSNDPGAKIDQVVLTVTRGAKRLIWWRWIIIDALCKSLNCKPTIHKGIGFKALGRLNDLVMLDEMLTWICVQVERLAKESGYSGKDGQDSFKKGCARTIAERLTANLKQIETTNEQYGALMVIENALVEAEFVKRYPKMTTYKGGKGGVSSGRAYKSGKIAGNNVSLTAGKKLTHG